MDGTPRHAFTLGTTKPVFQSYPRMNDPSEHADTENGNRRLRDEFGKTGFVCPIHKAVLIGRFDSWIHPDRRASWSGA